jgi:ABC-type multidrug transport system fused ATPase/permease subunit
VNFSVKEGEKVGLVGPSGCGKSTILKLLLGFYSCQSGAIVIDGNTIEDYSVHCLRKHFGVVSQEPELFDETIEYNIVYNEDRVDN